MKYAIIILILAFSLFFMHPVSAQTADQNMSLAALQEYYNAAQAGDVNVNAIAPGIAAALAATVAGLAVAIPALFGYNYLLTRIKATTSDMQVFIDELITRVGEGIELAQMPVRDRAAAE